VLEHFLGARHYEHAARFRKGITKPCSLYFKTSSAFKPLKMKSTLLLIVYYLALTTARIPTNQHLEVNSVTPILASSPTTLKKSRHSDRIQLDLCDCQPATGEPGGLSCDKEGFFIASFERQGQWVAGGGAVPLSHAICCRPCIPADLPDDSSIFDESDRPLALVSMGCHTSTDPLGVRCEADNTDANSFVSGFTSSVHVFSSVDTQYPVDTAQCCTPALLMESGDAWELERCDCGVSTDPDHSVSCSDTGGDHGGDGGKNKKINSSDSSSHRDITMGTILSGFDFFRISPLGQVVPIGPAKCCGVCLSGKVHPAADCRDVNHCSGNGVCLLWRCECLEGWGSPDCSQSLAGKDRWKGKIPPWAISLIVIGSCLLAMIILSVSAHAVELIFEARNNRDDDSDDDENRRPLLLRIDADDAGSVGSVDTEGDEYDNAGEDAVLRGRLEERIDQVIHRLEETEETVGEGGGGNGGGAEEGAEIISDGEGVESGEETLARDGVHELEHREEEETLATGSSVPTAASLSSSLSSTSARELGIDMHSVQAAAGDAPQQEEHDTSVEEAPEAGRGASASEEARTTPAEEGAAQGVDDNLPEKPPAGTSSHLQSYMGIGPLSGVDCVVCMIRPVQTVVIPCGHVCMCRRCSRRLNRCPVCRKDVLRRQRLFV